MRLKKQKNDYYVTEKTDENPLLSCFLYFVHRTADLKLLYTLRKKLVLHLASILFKAERPIELASDVKNLELSPKCFDHGAVRLWGYMIHKNSPKNVPEKVKHWYLQKREDMLISARKAIVNPVFIDKYTWCHLFGDVYNVEVYLDKKHVQNAAVLPLGYEMKHLKCYIKTVRKTRYALKLQKHEPKKRRPSFNLPQDDDIGDTAFIQTKYRLIKVLANNAEINLGSFIPLKNQPKVHTIALEDWVEQMTLKIHSIFNKKTIEECIYVFGVMVNNIRMQYGLDKDRGTFKLKSNHNVTKLYVVEAMDIKSAEILLNSI